MSSKFLNKLDEPKEVRDPDNLIKIGIDTICQSFKTNTKNYNDQIKEQKKIINDLNKKLQLMKEEIEMIQRENQYYKTQNEKLKNEIENLNKVINNIKGKLSNFDFKINNKKIIDNVNHENMKNDYITRENTNFKNYFKKENFNINNIHNSNKENIFNPLDYTKNSKTIKYDIKNYGTNEINNSGLNNKNNILDINDNIQELNIGKFKKFVNEPNYINTNINKNKKLSHRLYTHKSKILESKDLINMNDSPLNFLNIKIKEGNRNHNNNLLKLKKLSYNSFDISSAINFDNKNNINFNYNEYENKKETDITKKNNEKSKVRSNSSNNVIQRNNIKNDRLKMKYKTNRNTRKGSSLLLYDSKSPTHGLNHEEYKNKICKTFQNQKKFEKNTADLNGNICLKELKMKEMTFFLKKCKVYLEQNIFDRVVKLFQEYKKGILTDDGMIQKIKHCLRNNSELLDLFKNIIS